MRIFVEIKYKAYGKSYICCTESAEKQGGAFYIHAVYHAVGRIGGAVVFQGIPAVQLVVPELYTFRITGISHRICSQNLFSTCAVSGYAGVPQPPEVYFIILRTGGLCRGHSVRDDLFLLGYRDCSHHHTAVCVHCLQADTLFYCLSAHTQGDEECPAGTVDCFHRLPYHHLLFGHTGLLRGERCSARCLQEHRGQHVVGSNYFYNSGIRRYLPGYTTRAHPLCVHQFCGHSHAGNPDKLSKKD